MSHSLSLEGIPDRGHKVPSGPGRRFKHVLDDHAYHDRLMSRREYGGILTDARNRVQETLHRFGLLKDSVEVTVERLAGLPQPDARFLPPLLLIEAAQPITEMPAAIEWDGAHINLRVS